MVLDSLPPPVRDAVYLAVGLPAVAAEELQRATRRVAADLRPRAEALSHRVGDLLPTLTVTPLPLDDLGSRLDSGVHLLEERVEGALDRIGEQLPGAARDVVNRTRDAARDAGTQIRTLVSRAA